MSETEKQSNSQPDVKKPNPWLNVVGLAEEQLTVQPATRQARRRPNQSQRIRNMMIEAMRNNVLDVTEMFNYFAERNVHLPIHPENVKQRLYRYSKIIGFSFVGKFHPAKRLPHHYSPDQRSHVNLLIRTYLKEYGAEWDIYEIFEILRKENLYVKTDMYTLFYVLRYLHSVRMVSGPRVRFIQQKAKQL